MLRRERRLQHLDTISLFILFIPVSPIAPGAVVPKKDALVLTAFFGGILQYFWEISDFHLPSVVAEQFFFCREIDFSNVSLMHYTSAYYTSDDGWKFETVRDTIRMRGYTG